MSTSCTGWHISHNPSLDGHGIANGNWDLGTGPYAVCGPVGKVTTGQEMLFWCYATNSYGHIWVYGRVVGGNTTGWESIDNFKSVVSGEPRC